MPRADLPAGVVLSREGDAWIREDRVRDVALPVYEGKMIYVGNWAHSPTLSNGVTVGGAERIDLAPGFLLGARNLLHSPSNAARLVFRAISNSTNERSFVSALLPGWFPCGNGVTVGGAERIDLAPGFLLGARNLLHSPSNAARLVFRAISNSTNERSFVSALLPGWFPCGNAVPVIEPTTVGPAKVEIAAYLSSFAFDWSLRQRMVGMNLNWHVAESLALPPPKSVPLELSFHYARLAFQDIHFAPDWLRLAPSSRVQTAARTPHERLRVAAMVDAVVAAAMGLSKADLHHILAECDHPNDAALRQPKGFWRVDKDRPPELRQTVLTLLAFESLLEHGNGDPSRATVDFLTTRTDGWHTPEAIRLADHNLGHADRAEGRKPVATALGPRFYDWQLAQPADEAIRERHLHARNLLGELDYARLLRQQERGDHSHPGETLRQAAEERAEYDVGRPDDGQPEIFE